MSVIGSRDLTHQILALEDDWKLIGFVMAAERLVADGNGEKSGEAEGLVVARSFEVAPERLRTHIDAKYRLGLRPHLGCRPPVRLFRRVGRISSLGGSEATELEPELRQQLFAVAGLESLEPYRPMLPTRESHRSSRAAARKFDGWSLGEQRGFDLAARASAARRHAL